MRIAFTLLVALLLVGCARQDMTDLEEFVADVKARPPSGISPAPEPTEVETFLYVPAGRRNPFVPQSDPEEEVQEVADNGLVPDFNRRKEELEHYSLDTLRMVGTLEQDGATWGLVQTQDGTIHRVAVGNYMGRNHGRVVQIAEDRIKLVELIQFGSGYQEQEAGLSLAEGGQ